MAFAASETADGRAADVGTTLPGPRCGDGRARRPCAAQVWEVPLPRRSGRGWFTGIVASDGCVYFPSDGATAVLVAEPTENPLAPRIWRLSRPADCAQDDEGPHWLAWGRGALSADGASIVCGPFDAGSILVIDTLRRAARAEPLPAGLREGRGKWSDVALADGGRLVAAPFEAASVLCLAPDVARAGDSGGGLAPMVAEAIRGPSLQAWAGALDRDAGPKWTRGVLAADGCLYCGPLSAPSVLRVDPQRQSLTMLGDFGCMQGKWNEGTLGSDGNVYFSPDGAMSVLVVDPCRQEASTFGELAEGRRKWTQGVLANNGCIYCSPLCTTSVLVIDCSRQTVRLIDVLGDVADGRFLWTRGAMAASTARPCAPALSSSSTRARTRLPCWATWGRSVSNGTRRCWRRTVGSTLLRPWPELLACWSSRHLAWFGHLTAVGTSPRPSFACCVCSCSSGFDAEALAPTGACRGTSCSTAFSHASAGRTGLRDAHRPSQRYRGEGGAAAALLEIIRRARPGFWWQLDSTSTARAPRKELTVPRHDRVGGFRRREALTSRSMVAFAIPP